MMCLAVTTLLRLHRFNHAVDPQQGQGESLKFKLGAGSTDLKI